MSLPPSAKTPVRDRLGKTILTVSDSALTAFHEAGLVDLYGRRGVVTHATIKPGICVASLHAAMRGGAGNRLPVAEDQRTVIARRSRRGGGIHYDQIHVAAWDDGRESLALARLDFEALLRMRAREDPENRVALPSSAEDAA